MAINNNRIRCAAATNGFGVINTFAAETGFLAPTNLWANSGGMAVGTIGTHHYLLEDGAGGWELGTVVTTSTSASTRTVVQSNMNAGAGFANDVTGLTMSMVGDDMAALACRRTTLTEDAPSAAGVGLAAGAGAAAADEGVAVGYQAQARGLGAVAVGSNSGLAAEHQYSTIVGAGATTYAAGATALGAYAMAFFPGQVSLGTSLSLVPIFGSHTATASVMYSQDTFASVAGPAFDAGNWFSGYVAVKAYVHIEDFDDSGLAFSKMFTADYHVFSDGTTITVLGTPTITTIYTGASVGTSVLTIDSATGIPALTYSGGGATHQGESAGVLVVTRMG